MAERVHEGNLTISLFYVRTECTSYIFGSSQYIELGVLNNILKVQQIQFGVPFSRKNGSARRFIEIISFSL